MRDEQDLTDELERVCGGAERTFRLLGIYRRASDACSGNHFQIRGKLPDQTEIFTKAAKRDGYTDEQIRAFLSYQGAVS